MDDNKKNGDGNSDGKDTNVSKTTVDSGQLFRPEMVSVARKFMLLPKIRETPFEQQRRFLLQKGVWEEEIKEACRRLPQALQYHGNAITRRFITNSGSLESSTSGNVFLRLLKFMMIFTGFSYAFWRLLRSHILPRFFALPEPIEDRMRAVELKIDEMNATLRDVKALVSSTSRVINVETALRTQRLRQPYDKRRHEEIQRESIERINAYLSGKQLSPRLKLLGRRRLETDTGTDLQDASNCATSSLDDVNKSDSPPSGNAETEPECSGPTVDKDDSDDHSGEKC